MPALKHNSNVRKPRESTSSHGGFIRRFELRRDEITNFDHYPFNIPAIRSLEKLELDPRVTIFVGENGSGKSTLVEAIAVALGLNAEGGTKNFKFSTHVSHSDLSEYLQIVRGPFREKDSFFLRAEGVYNVATEIVRLDSDPWSSGPPIIESYGGVSLHAQSHGESFLAMVENRFRGNGVYVLDEPESALSPSRQIALLSILHDLSHNRSSQVIMSTHSPILMAIPGARILHLSQNGMAPINYEDTEHYRITKMFLDKPEAFLRHLNTPCH